MLREQDTAGNTAARRPRCGGAELLVTWQAFADGTRHVRPDCRRCRRWVCYLPRTPGNAALADAGTSSAPLLDLLLQLEARGITVARVPGGLRFDPARLMTAGLRAPARQAEPLLARVLQRGIAV